MARMMLDGAVVLAGGRATRFGGIDKVLLEVGGHALLAGVVRAARDAGATTPVVVGPERPGIIGVLWTSEQPTGGGPAAAIKAGLPLAGAGLVAVLAGDLPFLTVELLSLLIASAGEVGAIAVDEHGREQWLLGVHRDLPAGEEAHGRSARSLLDRPGLVRVELPGSATWDCDTAEDLDRARLVAG